MNEDSSYFQIANDYFNNLSQQISLNNYEKAQNLLHEVITNLKDSEKIINNKSYLSYSRDRMKGSLYYMKGDLKRAKKMFYTLISNYPRIHRQYMAGLVDILVMMSEVYSMEGKYEDSLHSARLAVSVIHKRVEFLHKVENEKSTKKYSEWILHDFGSLSPRLAASLAYYNLAQRLDENSLEHLSQEWYGRALNVLELEDITDTMIVNEITNHIHQQNESETETKTDKTNEKDENDDDKK